MPYTPQNNAFAECINKSYRETIRILLEEAILSRRYWYFAFYYIVFIKNRFYHSSIEGSPFEKFTGEN